VATSHALAKGRCEEQRSFVLYSIHWKDHFGFPGLSILRPFILA